MNKRVDNPKTAWDKAAQRRMVRDSVKVVTVCCAAAIGLMAVLSSAVWVLFV